MACKHVFEVSDRLCYEVCRGCESYHSITAPPAEEVYARDYWSEAREHSTIRDQVYNVDTHTEGGVSKYQFVLDRIDVADRCAALEIGCAPGRLLLHLRGIGRFERVVGIEVDRSYEKEIREIGCFGGELIFGYFPSATAGLDSGSFSLVAGLDIFEHSHEPEAFLKECARLLKPGGQLMLMLPLIGETEMPERMFHPVEHVFLHSRRNMIAMLGDAGFGRMVFGRWCAGHDLVRARLNG